MVDFPKAGEPVPVEMFHVSKCNVRYNVVFGLTEKDKNLEENLKYNRIKLPMHARPEEGTYGIYIGKGRLEARGKYTTHFIVGEEVLFFDISEEEARIASFIENNDYLKKTMNPLTYAENLNMIASKSGGIRATARRLGISPSGVSEYLTMLEGLSSKKMRMALRKQGIPYKGKGSSDPHSMLGIAKMKLGKDKLDELAEVLNDGTQALYNQIDFMTTGKQKRGLPKNAYDVFRVTWKKSNKFERQYAENISLAAKNKEQTEADYIKNFLINHMKEIEKEARAET